MGFKELQDLDASTVIALGGRNKKTGKENPSTVEGYYLGSRKVDSKKNKTGFSYIHILSTPKGNLGVWGKTDLDRKILSVSPGTMIRATHVGMLQVPTGEMYKYKVEIDDSNTIEVTAALGNQAVEQDSNDGVDGNTYEEDTESSYESEDNEEDSAQSAALLAAERKAKVQELLNRKNKKA